MFRTLYAFTDQNGDGSGPFAGLVVAKNGVLYGSTESGGIFASAFAFGCGTVYELTRTAGGSLTEIVLYDFTGQNGDGAAPEGALVIGEHGALYGTTVEGGSSGAGTVFRLAPPAVPGGPWTETVLYSFTSQNGDGANPEAGLVIGPKGALYGTTVAGGSANLGTVFALTPPAVAGGRWTEIVLHSFTGQNGDGAWPGSQLAIGGSGAFYGTTVFGGSGPCAAVDLPVGCGTVFELQPPAARGGAWTETIIHSFNGPPYDGDEPYASVLVGANGVLYGTTFIGGYLNIGTVFELVPPTIQGGVWTEYVLTYFPTAGDPFVPFGGLVFGANGVLYGTSLGGGTYGYGTVFELTPPPASSGTWTLSTVFSFGNSSSPYATLATDANGLLFGTAYVGGNYQVNQIFGSGTVFELKP